jgi:hypothetical protein
MSRTVRDSRDALRHRLIRPGAYGFLRAAWAGSRNGVVKCRSCDLVTSLFREAKCRVLGSAAGPGWSY